MEIFWYYLQEISGTPIMGFSVIAILPLIITIILSSATKSKKMVAIIVLCIFALFPISVAAIKTISYYNDIDSGIKLAEKISPFNLIGYYFPILIYLTILCYVVLSVKICKICLEKSKTAALFLCLGMFAIIFALEMTFIIISKNIYDFWLYTFLLFTVISVVYFIFILSIGINIYMQYSENTLDTIVGIQICILGVLLVSTIVYTIMNWNNLSFT